MVEKKRYESPTASVIFHVEDAITMSAGTPEDAKDNFVDLEDFK